MEISTYVALLNAQNAEIIWYVDGRIIKRKVQRTDNQALLHLFLIQSFRSSACHSNSINAEVVERNNVHLNRILSQPDIIKQIASNVIEELKQKHSNQTEIKYDIDSLENKKLSLKHNKNDC